MRFIIHFRTKILISIYICILAQNSIKFYKTPVVNFNAQNITNNFESIFISRKRAATTISIYQKINLANCEHYGLVYQHICFNAMHIRTETPFHKYRISMWHQGTQMCATHLGRLRWLESIQSSMPKASQPHRQLFIQSFNSVIKSMLGKYKIRNGRKLCDVKKRKIIKKVVKGEKGNKGHEKMAFDKRKNFDANSRN